MADIYLPVDSQRRLIEIARETLDNFVCGRGGQRPESEDPYLEAADYGAFVTLFKENELRGCIGTCNPAGSLCQTVVEMTEAAASRDGRMRPVSATSWSASTSTFLCCRLEAKLRSLSLIVGEHGLHVARKGSRGVAAGRCRA
jgi:AMMECR1 domain-containing protein